MLKVSFSQCIELPSWAGALPTNSPNYYVSVVQRQPYFKALEVHEDPLNKPIHTCPHTSNKYQNDFRNWLALDKQL